MPCFIYPCTNLHGSSASELRDAALEMRGAVRELIALIDAAAPNARDYYPLGDDAYRLASAGRTACANGLALIADELLRLGDSEFRQEADVGPFNFETIPEVPPVFPVIHLNGTDTCTLREEAVAVFRKATAVAESLSRLAPNPRDYADRDQWAAARSQWHNQVAGVKRVGGYFLQMALSTKGARHHSS